MHEGKGMPPTPEDPSLMPKPNCMLVGRAQGKLTVAVARIHEAGAVHVSRLSRTTGPEFKPDRSQLTKQSKGTQVATSMTPEGYASFASEVLQAAVEEDALGDLGPRSRRCSPVQGRSTAD